MSGTNSFEKFKQLHKILSNQTESMWKRLIFHNLIKQGLNSLGFMFNYASNIIVFQE